MYVEWKRSNLTRIDAFSAPGGERGDRRIWDHWLLPDFHALSIHVGTQRITYVTYFIWLTWFMFKKHAGGQMYGEENRASSLRGTRWHEESVAGPRDVHPELQYVPLGAEGDMNMDDQRPSWIWFDPYCMIWMDVRVIQFFTISSQFIVLETPSHLATCEYYLLSILGRN